MTTVGEMIETVDTRDAEYAAEAAAVKRLTELVEAYKECFACPAGAVVLADLAQKFGFMHGPMYAAGAMGPNAADDCVWRDGGRSVLAYIGLKLEMVFSEKAKVGEGT